VLFVGAEELSQSAGPVLDYLGGQLFEMRGRSARPQVELVYVHYSEFILLDEFEAGLKLLFRLLREPTDDVSGDSHSGHVL
jgi:hypothetical protein